MDKQTLEKANELARKLKELNEALNCFEYFDPEFMKEPMSTNPRLFIEHDCEDGEGKCITPLPMNLSDALTDFLKAEIKTSIGATQKEFDELEPTKQENNGKVLRAD